MWPCFVSMLTLGPLLPQRWFSVIPEVGKLRLLDQIQPAAVSVNKVLLGHSLVHWFCVVCGCLCTVTTEMSSCDTAEGLQSLNYLLPASLQKTK